MFTLLVSDLSESLFLYVLVTCGTDLSIEEAL